MKKFLIIVAIITIPIAAFYLSKQYEKYRFENERKKNSYVYEVTLDFIIDGKPVSLVKRSSCYVESYTKAGGARFGYNIQEGIAVSYGLPSGEHVITEVPNLCGWIRVTSRDAEGKALTYEMYDVIDPDWRPRVYLGDNGTVPTKIDYYIKRNLDYEKSRIKWQGIKAKGLGMGVEPDKKDKFEWIMKDGRHGPFYAVINVTKLNLHNEMRAVIEEKFKNYTEPVPLYNFRGTEEEKEISEWYMKLIRIKTEEPFGRWGERLDLSPYIFGHKDINELPKDLKDEVNKYLSDPDIDFGWVVDDISELNTRPVKFKLFNTQGRGFPITSYLLPYDAFPNTISSLYGHSIEAALPSGNTYLMKSSEVSHTSLVPVYDPKDKNLYMIGASYIETGIYGKGTFKAFMKNDPQYAKEWW